MLRTVSDGADVVLDDRGHEWVIVNAYGTGKREDTEGREINTVMPDVDIDTVALKRTNSLQDDRSQYRHVHVNAPEHLAVDVDLCESVWKLKKHERLLAKRADEMAVSRHRGAH